jgi:NDP-sugar pyrophosphorylase family protein
MPNDLLFIMCAGKNTRWQNNKPKALAEFNGIPNIIRTIGLIKDYGFNIDQIFLTVNNNNYHYFYNFDVKLIIGSCDREIDRFRNVFNYIDNCSRVVLLYGDTFYDSKDIYKILDKQSDCFFGRLSGNKLTQKPHQEIFGIVIKNIEMFRTTVNNVVKKYDEGKLKREIGWDVYNLSLSQHNKKITRIGRNGSLHSSLIQNNIYEFISLSDYTDDFDSIEEYELIKNTIAIQN